ncbi:enhanced serine sensitivity protein SseB C-terminal domain-containing protein [Haliangium sp. UPWRP_2]|uniref:enhanced serine sensitivity protein SseB C-terminal domain-containing protein n=1 Tax=Haliangium sp. UPWRP_2 TaxID=1931276 RepID=UPI000B540E60|nr:enhanced serine sensitivity protein SseB C-terminal domain-containing protein [Haliangium sp. UPWRP_2]PSM31306.1 hypothetical protein BVG81_006100 [Haliangium sp. UPWRP_2]
MHPTQPPFAFGSGGWWVLTLEQNEEPEKMTPLDKALQEAKDTADAADAFYSLFLNTAVFIPTHDPAAESSGSRRTAPGETFHPFVVESEGKPYLPVFDTHDRLTAWAGGHPMTYIQMAAHALIRSSLDPKLHLALNVGTPNLKVFVPEELERLRQVHQAQTPKQFTVPAGTRVLVGAPASVPDGIEESLRHCLERNEEVESAYLGQVHFMIEGSKPELFLVLKIDDTGKEHLDSIQEDIGVALRGFLQKGENLTLQVYDGKGTGSGVVEAVKPFYVRKR